MKAFLKAIIGVILLFFSLNYPLQAKDNYSYADKPSEDNNDVSDYLDHYVSNNPSYLGFGVGSFDTDHSEMSAAGTIEFRYGKKLFNAIGPLIGIMGNTDGGFFGYGGIYGDIRFWNFAITPFFSVGGYDQGGSKNLGGIFNFREGITFAYERDNGDRIGIRYNHISSAGINKQNPGENELLVTYDIALPF
ncbi:lipid A 3-O-deacylase-like protein [Candidatus Nitrosoglobus terrae]|uniref:Lipid A 3-O-deacylase-like protein n=1 Tax=Candidatus Nitrosoglobus terrae TaxID=1630141 RepID=A0A1Q2SMY5_9GAMM|nr:acyloxyacyl hydrolase [Candidatus Nitrosoglobus terrae]BAW80467.1 lipid A 3-O-deacylase-like protein [Candidatus Nitrosoglobus terrae]